MQRTPRLIAAALAAAALALPAAASARPRTTYFVSLGDSYAQGVQPIGANQADVATNNGYNDFLFRTLHRRHAGLKAVKLGCGGATTDSMINGTKPCSEKLPYKSTSKATSQLTYAAKFMRAHRGRIAFVTLSIGGNDFAHCASAGDFNAVLSCTSQGVDQMKKNLPVIARTLRRAAGKKTVIVASTYPDIVLGAWVKSDNGKTLARASVPVFKNEINPAMKSSYSKQHIGFVDATAGFGGYVPLDQTTTLAPYGVIPKAVASICTLGWYCIDRAAGPDIHLRTPGYRKLAGEYTTAIRKLQHGRL